MQNTGLNIGTDFRFTEQFTTEYIFLDPTHQCGCCCCKCDHDGFTEYDDAATLTSFDADVVM